MAASLKWYAGRDRAMAASKEFDHVQIKLDEWGKGSVIVNGHPLKSSLGVSLEANGGETTIVTIRLLASADVDVLAKAVESRVVMPMQMDEEQPS